MRISLSHLKEKAIALRMEGYSYGHIKKTLNLKSKGTISMWLKDVVIPEQARKKLEKNNLLAIKRGLLSFNTERSAKIKVENKFVYTKGFESVPKNLNKRDLLLIGIALYWAEGGKTGGDGPSPKFVFSNSDPEMIKVFMRFIREILSINDKDIRGGIHLYPNTDILEARSFWSKISGLPVDRFYIITQISRASKGIREKKLAYGTLHVKINRRLVFFKMKGMIAGLIKNLEI